MMMQHPNTRSDRKTAGCLVFSIVAALIVSFGQFQSAGEASAQSVRPPANATTNSTPPKGLPRAQAPSRIPPPSVLKSGKVPGGSLGNRSQADYWKAVRQGFTGQVSIPDKKSGALVTSSGKDWQQFRNNKMYSFGAWLMLATVVILALFYLIRGSIKIEKGRSGQIIQRFGAVERWGHWLLAGTFIILAITGLNMLYGRYILKPVVSPELFSTITIGGKYLHDFVAFAFMLGLVWIFVQWIRENIPNRHDLIWLAKGGGFFGKHVHPPARKFNAGQKIIFWLVVISGVSLSFSGLALILPFKLFMFSDTFALLNMVGFNLPTDLSPVQEMQLSQLWHGILGLIMIAVIIAHIYIGTIGMEGGFEAMGSGKVDRNWALEHHSLWVEELDNAGQEDSPDGAAQAAE